MEEEGRSIHQILVKLLNGKHKILTFTTPSISVETLKDHIQSITSVPSDLHLLLRSDSPYPLQNHQTLTLATDFPLIVHLLLRLRGGKGGFGSLLRGAATKAGQKKTNNFDACRDMSGRRLRHVNAEKKLEEWRAEAEERKLEKMAEDYLKKKAKEVEKKKGKGGSDGTDKYVNKYREDSAKCMEEVERSVRESLKGIVASKRQGLELNQSDSKKLKIWLGKRPLGDSDSEDMDDDDNTDEEEDERSVVIDSGNNSDSSKEERIPGSVTGNNVAVESFEKGTSESRSEEEKDSAAEQSPESGGSFDGYVTNGKASCVAEPVGDIREGRIVVNKGASHSEASALHGTEHFEPEKEVSSSSDSDKVDESSCQPQKFSTSGQGGTCVAEINGGSSTRPIVQQEALSAEALHLGKPLDFDEYNSATDLEVLGLERLKSELQAHGLKCGGTLQERAARLFLLKTTPVEMLPKKLLAKK